MIYIKYCKKCGEAFDINISKDLCPGCRKEKNEEKKDGRTTDGL